MEFLSTPLVDAAVAAVSAVLAWVAVSVRKYIQVKVENDYVEKLLLRISDAVEVAVRDLKNTMVPLIREISQDGKITSREAIKLREKAREIALTQLTKVDRQSLEELFDREHLEKKLDQLIEAKVQSLKEGMD